MVVTRQIEAVYENDVHRRESLDAVVAADTALCQVGAAAGLPVINPEVPS
jgi:hypothetical protein